MSGAHPGYEKAVMDELEPGWVEYRGYVSFEELAAAYRRAKAAILASYFETCGFSALEAVTCGAQVCISDTPYTREFYEGHAVFCDPFSTRFDPVRHRGGTHHSGPGSNMAFYTHSPARQCSAKPGRSTHV